MVLEEAMESHNGLCFHNKCLNLNCELKDIIFDETFCVGKKNFAN